MLEHLKKAMETYEVILEPDENTPEWWAGAPSVMRTPDGAFYLAARMREGNSPRGVRGYEIRILRSDDGHRFETAHRITREAAGVPGFERPALVRDPKSGKYRLYACCLWKQGWAIIQFDDADSPEAFKPETMRPVLFESFPDDGFARFEGYKDPFVFWDGTQWRMFVIGCDRVERIHQFLSDDGGVWRPAPGWPALENTGWHNFYTRPACILPLAVGYLLVYEGSDIRWNDPVYNIATGLAYTLDLERFADLTPDEPLLRSTTPGDYHTWRYSHWLTVGDKVHVYFEAARPNKTNEIRLAVLDRPTIP